MIDVWSYGGIRYQDIEVYIDQSYNPLRLPRVEADQSRGSKAGDPASIEGTQRERDNDLKDPECQPGDSLQGNPKE